MDASGCGKEACHKLLSVLRQKLTDNWSLKYHMRPDVLGALLDLDDDREWEGICHQCECPVRVKLIERIEKVWGCFLISSSLGS